MITKKFTLAVLLALLINVIVPITFAHAAGGSLWPNVRLSASAASTAANGSDTITISAYFYVYECNNGSVEDSTSDCDASGGVKGEKALTASCPYNDTIVTNVGVAGDGAVLSKTGICGGSGGTDTFTVKSSVVGAKTITATTSWSYGSGTRTSNPTTITFTAPPAAAPAAKPKTVAPVVAPTPTASPVVEKPAVPTVATVTVGSKEVKTDEAISFTVNQPLVLSGKTVPNGKVAVYVFSDPKLFETTADKEGTWTVSVKGLPEGSHHAEVEVTDPVTNQKSDRTKLLEFKVVAAKKPIPAPAPKESSKTGLWIGLAVILLLAGAITGFILWKRKRKAKTSTPEDQNIIPPAPVAPSEN